jgi:Mce-associated membrane protein
MLSYRPETVEKDLGAARDRLTGALEDSYGSLTHDVVIPGSKQKMISATASVPAAGAVSASPNHAVVLMFVNQTITEGNDPPTNTASRVRVSLDKVGGRWLISSFDPI